MEQSRICLGCSKVVLAGDTIVLALGRIAHFDCTRPRILGPEERSLLYRYCWERAVANCEPCARRYRPSELASDLLSDRDQLCPRCRTDLTESVRAHLYACAMLPEEVRRRAREARET